eukprot:m.158410 g.158410  ORF g.158410 m.158410 type:complete len:66 (+) comp38736_c0_seq8:878-1075(+)
MAAVAAAEMDSAEAALTAAEALGENLKTEAEQEQIPPVRFDLAPFRQVSPPQPPPWFRQLTLWTS